MYFYYHTTFSWFMSISHDLRLLNPDPNLTLTRSILTFLLSVVATDRPLGPLWRLS